MNHDFRGKNLLKTRVLVVPLDWGLGHATRCIPIIRELELQGCEVWLAGEGAQAVLLKTEFPHLNFLELSGYRVKYARSAIGLLKSLISQVPHITRVIRREHRWLKKMVAEHGFAAVISDNRYGLYHKTIPCIFVTHQLFIKNPLGKFAGRLLQRKNYHYINRFTACWVPDNEGSENLAGELSHPSKLPVVPINYVGALSRFEIKNIPQQKDKLLVILSGPEPQRSILEDKIIQQIAHYNGTATIVRGLPGTLTVIPSSNMLKFYNHLNAEALNKEMEEAEWVISRSGYSTVMDLISMQKKSILIPTPGQSEQEYLADYLSNKHIVCSIKQNNFSLTDALEEGKKFNYQFPKQDNTDRLRSVIEKFIHSL